MNITLLGLPGAGKGTQAAQIVAKFNLPHISTGEIFRAAVKDKTPLGLQAKHFLDLGKLVPDDVTIGIVEERLMIDDCASGFLLDGFPRTTAQANALDKFLAKQSKKLDVAIYIEVSRDELINRLSNRWVCRNCSASFHLLYAPPQETGRCDFCSSELYQREDDKKETVINRLQVNVEQINYLLNYYEKNDVLTRIDGEAPIDEVTKSIYNLLRGYKI